MLNNLKKKIWMFPQLVFLEVFVQNMLSLRLLTILFSVVLNDMQVECRYKAAPVIGVAAKLTQDFTDY